jgi:hypothetical protein
LPPVRGRCLLAEQHYQYRHTFMTAVDHWSPATTKTTAITKQRVPARRRGSFATVAGSAETVTGKR